jgi:hypothetical protein
LDAMLLATVGPLAAMLTLRFFNVSGVSRAKERQKEMQSSGHATLHSL